MQNSIPPNGDATAGMVAEEQKRPIPLSEIADHLRNQQRLSPALQKDVDQSPEHRGSATDIDFDIKQVAAILKAAEIAAQTVPDHPANFQFAAGCIAGHVLDDADFAKAKALAATL